MPAEENCRSTRAMFFLMLELSSLRFFFICPLMVSSSLPSMILKALGNRMSYCAKRFLKGQALEPQQHKRLDTALCQVFCSALIRLPQHFPYLLKFKLGHCRKAAKSKNYSRRRSCRPTPPGFLSLCENSN